MLMEYCEDCGSRLSGRTDKRFCDDHCRNHYNNARNQLIRKRWNSVNSRLRRNALLLEQFYTAGINPLPCAMLSAAGFRFSYLTSCRKDKAGNYYYCCYDYGYRFTCGRAVEICPFPDLPEAEAGHLPDVPDAVVCAAADAGFSRVFSNLPAHDHSTPTETAARKRRTPPGL